MFNRILSVLASSGGDFFALLFALLTVYASFSAVRAGGLCFSAIGLGADANFLRPKLCLSCHGEFCRRTEVNFAVN